MSADSQPAAPAATELAVTGLNCNNCARKVTGIILGFAGVASVSVSLEQERASIRWQPAVQPDLPKLLAALKNAGYASTVIEANAPAPTSKFGGWAVNLLLGIPVTLVLMLGEWVFRLGEVRWFAWVGFALAGAVQIFAGAKFYRGAWAQLKARSSNMDTLVSLGSTTAFAYSAWALLAGWPGHLYFMEAAAIITLISVGHWIEARVGAKAASSLKALMTLAPQTARRLAGSGTGVPPVRPTSSRPFAVISSEFRLPTVPPPDRLKAELQTPTAAAPIETDVPVAQLHIDGLVALRPGDRVPVDGEVVEGESTVDEAMLTGESAPVDKTAKSLLYAGTTNLNGRLVMRVTATGEATALAHIIAAVQRAQTSRASIQRLGDRVSNVFVPVVCVIALGTALWWGLAYESARQVTAWLAPFLWHAHPPASPLAAAVIAAAAVLIVACPCAMGLATPAAIMAAANAAARRGILIRDGVALEKAGLVTAVLFDKTGTLTMGKPTVVESWHGDRRRRREESPISPGQSEPPHVGSYNLNELAVALAKNSTHPISQAIARSAPVPGRSDVEYTAAHGTSTRAAIPTSQRPGTGALPELTDWREVRGAGVEARLADLKSEITNLKSPMARLGSLRWLREAGVNLAAGDAFTNGWSAQGATIVGLAVESELLGLFAVQDALKPGAADVVRQLQAGGLKTFLVTGDNAATAAGIARHAGIPAENVFAEVRPEQKAEFVKQLQARGERVAFVGDGINDAPALEQADLGVAVCRASDVAREAADIILLKSDIEAVPESLGLARATLRTIKQNLFWAFFYNVASVPLAALGFMSPVLCAAAMGASDLIVIGNALRLRGWRR
jgi:Cu+-exporting ATPase